MTPAIAGPDRTDPKPDIGSGGAEAALMNTAASTRLPAEVEFSAARDAADLVPGHSRSVTVLGDVLAGQATAIDDATAAMARGTGSLDWSGAAADAFAAHRRAVLGCADQWTEAASLAGAALVDHQQALVRAQDGAAEALRLWQQAQRLADSTAMTTTAPTALAANAVAVRQDLDTAVTQARRRAAELLHHARTSLADSGDATARAIQHTRELLDAADLPTLRALTTPPRPGTTSTSDGSPGARTPLPDSTRWSGRTELVQPPAGGVHDTLWRIAARTLGGPWRWPEIYRLNAGHLVGDHGARLVNPNDLQPGWTLRIPTATLNRALPAGPITVPAPTGTPDAPAAPAPGGGASATPSGPLPSLPTIPPPAPTTPPPPPPAGPGSAAGAPTPSPAPPTTSTVPIAPTVPAPGTTSPAPTLTPLPRPGPATPAPVVDTTTHRGVDLGGGVVLAGGVVAGLAGVATLAGLARRLARRRAAAGQSLTEPVVRTLTADLTAWEPPPHPDPDREPDPDPDSGTYFLSLGYQRDHTVLYAAATLGLGLTGPGAPDAARALLISTLAQNPDATAVLPAADLRRLLGVGADTHPATGRITVAADLRDALAGLEGDVLTRVRLLEDSQGHTSPPPTLLITTAPADSRRLQAIADLGAGLGIVVVVLGAWPPGLTCHIDPDGTIRTHPGQHDPGWDIIGLRAFTAPAADTAALLDLLGTATEPAPDTRPQPIDTDGNGQVLSAGLAARLGGEAADHKDTGSTGAAAELRPRDAPARAEQRPRTHASTVNATPASTPEPVDALEIIAPTQAAPEPRTRCDPDVAARTPTRPPTGGPPGTGTGDKGSGRPSPHQWILRDDGEGRPAFTVPIRMEVLGPPRVYWSGQPDQQAPPAAREITDAFQPRTRELLVYLALHPRGVTRDALVTALWTDSSPGKTTNTLNTALSRLRRAVSRATDGAVGDIVIIGDSRYQLDPALVDVDYWHFDHAVHARRTAATERARIDAYRQVVDSYGGPLAEGMSTEWIESVREAIRRDAIDAVAALARSLVDTDPHQTLDLLEIARAFDPHNEALYRDIMRLQARLGQLDAIPRTLALLTNRLAEIDDHPSDEALTLATRLRHHDT